MMQVWVVINRNASNALIPRGNFIYIYDSSQKLARKRDVDLPQLVVHVQTPNGSDLIGTVEVFFFESIDLLIFEPDTNFVMAGYKSVGKVL